ncbi:MAG: phage tail protein [Firmicutes bacterium]|nr:phage tail protein [Bacillota bacterium]
MALGGGIWSVQNKVLPGTYINFSSVKKASAALSERGFAAMPLTLDWGPENQVFTVTNADFQKDSLKIFGYAYTDKAMQPLRELFRYTKTLYAYRLNGGGAKAANTYAEALFSGICGNKLSTVIAKNTDDSTLFDVSTYYDQTLIDVQTVANASELTANDFVTFKSDAELAATARTPLAGGTNGTAANEAYQDFLGKIESYSFNTIGCPSEDETVISLFVDFTKRMRNETGAKFQTVIFNPAENTNIADYEGIIEVGNKITDYDTSISGLGKFGLVYWTTGVSAGCSVNKSSTNKLYDGELKADVDYTQAELEKAIKSGRFMFHNVNGDVKVLEDINSLVTVSDEKGESFKSNQTVRVCDQIANDIAVIFNSRYLGIVPNDVAGRISLWNDICKIHQDLVSVRALEDFDPETVIVEQGDTKKSVICTIKDLNVTNAMAQLYMNIVIM